LISFFIVERFMVDIVARFGNIGNLVRVLAEP
jgi:hypothetical protein